MSRSVSPKRLDDEGSAGWTTYGTSRAAFSLFQGLASDVEDSSEKRHGVQALACRLGPLENGSHKLKLELHALFHSFRASQRDMKAPPKIPGYASPGSAPGFAGILFDRRRARWYRCVPYEMGHKKRVGRTDPELLQSPPMSPSKAVVKRNVAKATLQKPWKTDPSC